MRRHIAVRQSDAGVRADSHARWYGIFASTPSAAVTQALIAAGFLAVALIVRLALDPWLDGTLSHPT
ncbi:MAG: hypothetical protein ACXW2I_17480, partial [Burkholderiales bacterium]